MWSIVSSPAVSSETTPPGALALTRSITRRGRLLTRVRPLVTVKLPRLAITLFGSVSTAAAALPVSTSATIDPLWVMVPRAFS